MCLNIPLANSTNVSNLGNVVLDLLVRGNDDMVCALGRIGLGNISYNVSSGSYDSMLSKKLSNSSALEGSFDLGIEGVATPEEVLSSKNEYWSINVPAGVGGYCNNTITVIGVVG